MLNTLDWLIIGGWSPKTPIKVEQPKWEWVDSLLGEARTAGIPVYCKPNLPDFTNFITTIPKDYPKV
jgi:hypothetical protein